MNTTITLEDKYTQDRGQVFLPGVNDELAAIACLVAQHDPSIFEAFKQRESPSEGESLVPGTRADADTPQGERI